MMTDLQCKLRPWMLLYVFSWTIASNYCDIARFPCDGTVMLLSVQRHACSACRECCKWTEDIGIQCPSYSGQWSVPVGS